LSGARLTGAASLAATPTGLGPTGNGGEQPIDLSNEAHELGVK